MMKTMSRRYFLLVVLSLYFVCHGLARGQIASGNVADRITQSAPDPSDITCQCWIDGTLMNQEILPPAGGKLNWQLDVSGLADGIHYVDIQATDNNGAMSRTNHTLFYKVAVPVENGTITCQCWIDGTLVRQELLPTIGGSLNWQLDVSALSEGIHYIDIQATDINGAVSRTNHTLFYKVAVPLDYGTINCQCWIDGTLVRQESLPSIGGSLNWQLDVSDLPVGIHYVDIQATDINGAVTRTNRSLFYKMAQSSSTSTMKLTYDIDGQQSGVLAQSVQDGLYHFDIDVNGITDGMHTITCFVTDNNGEVTSSQRHFLKIPQDGYGVKRYEYWLNEKDSTNLPVKVELSALANPFKLVQFLPIEHWPIRSSYFHFAIEQGKPVVYALNDLHVCFYDECDRPLATSHPFIDVSVKQNVTSITLLQAGQTVTAPRPGENEILWYKVVAQKGDGIYFKADRACTIQIFSATGEELSNLSGNKSTDWGGVHAYQDGTYYVAQHDMTDAAGTTLDISYQHADPIVEGDWEILKEFYNQYHNSKLVWDMSDRYNAIDFEGLKVEMGRVTSLTLPDKTLQGRFPTVLLALDKLRKLDLSGSNLNGDVAADIAAYKVAHGNVIANISELNLSNNDFEGNVGALANLFGSLTSLNVSGNRFDQVNPLVKATVALNVSDQRLQSTGDLTNGLSSFIASLPEICRYSHAEQKLTDNIYFSMSNPAQSPKWIWNITSGDGQYSASGSGAYRGVIGQELPATTSLRGTWHNSQQLQLAFTFNCGDVNLNGPVEVTDLQAMVNYIFNDYNKPFNFTAANLNNDDALNVQDVVGEVGLLLSQTPREAANLPQRAPAREENGNTAALDWIDGVLYLKTNVPVAAIDIVNKVDNIQWLVEDLGMIVSSSRVDQGTHSVVYSLGDAVIPPGVTAIATTTSRPASVVVASLSDAEADPIPVVINSGSAGLKSISDDHGIVCRWEGSNLIISSDGLMSDVDVVIYTVDGRVAFEKHLSQLDCGDNSIDVMGLIDSNSYYIVALRHHRQILVSQKLTTINR